MSYSGYDLIDLRPALGRLICNRIWRAPGRPAHSEPAKVELIINLKTAKALGMEIPRLASWRADQVIE